MTTAPTLRGSDLKLYLCNFRDQMGNEDPVAHENAHFVKDMPLGWKHAGTRV